MPELMEFVTMGPTSSPSHSISDGTMGILVFSYE